MGGLLRQPHPHLVLLCLLGGKEGEDGDDDEEKHHAELDIGIGGEALDEQRLVVADVDERIVVYRDANHLTLRLPPCGKRGKLGQAVRCGRGGQRDVAEGLNGVVLVCDDDRNSVVVVDDTEHEGEVGGLVGGV